ncbi:MAG: helix-turn-helix transcriptional regulator [Caldilineaceae bacterium]|nr:helix-turn-helix transcriptional regulator [Caldilineaceae bacterium]
MERLIETRQDQSYYEQSTLVPAGVDPNLCPVEVAARIIGQKWTLQIVKTLLDYHSQRFCELQDALGGVNPSTLSSRLKMLEDEGLIRRVQVSAIPPHVEYSLTDMGCQLEYVIREISKWSRSWLCTAQRLQQWHDANEEQ